MYLYVKIFDNGKMYVGITNNFKQRMNSHNSDAYYKNSQLPVHNAMRKHNHRTEIWAQGIEDWDLLCELEKQTIAQLKEEGIELYNLTGGGEGTLGYGRLKGQLNPKSKPMEYYETNSILRSDFKRTCISQSWVFKHFKEVFDCTYIRTNGNKCKKYFYIYIGGNNKDYGIQKNEKEYYSTKSTQRAKFKRACKSHNWNFDDFEEVFSGEYYINPNTNERNKKYYYIYKGE